MSGEAKGAPAVELRDVSLRIGDRALVEHVTLSVPAGETLVLLGRSGSGKTTTLKLINRLHEPTSGEVWVEGRPAATWDPILLRRRVGYVIQESGLFPHYTVEENIGVVPRLEGWAEERIHDRVTELLALVGLEPASYRTRYPRQLSGGQRQRVGVARALAADPPIVLMDEPFGALDPITRVDLQRELRAITRSLGKTLVFVSHDLREAFFLASSIGLFSAGRLVHHGTPEELRRSDHPEARAFMASLDPGERPAAPAAVTGLSS